MVIFGSQIANDSVDGGLFSGHVISDGNNFKAALSFVRNVVKRRRGDNLASTSVFIADSHHSFSIWLLSCFERRYPRVDWSRRSN